MAKRPAGRRGRLPGQIREYALIGAQARLEELRREEAELRAQFPELFRGGAAPRKARSAPSARASDRQSRRKPNWSPEQRQAVAERMRKYWAERRKNSAKN